MVGKILAFIIEKFAIGSKVWVEGKEGSDWEERAGWGKGGGGGG